MALPKTLIEALAKALWENEKARELILQIAREGKKDAKSSHDPNSQNTDLQTDRRKHRVPSEHERTDGVIRQVQQVGSDRG